jgi:DNA topoisomerase I
MAELYRSLVHADDAGLLYVTDARAGISRRRRGKGFSYHHPDGTKVDDAERERIEALVIPPAWQDVWICPTEEGHLLATGRDTKDRKVYLYHPRWREVRDGDKYHRLLDFGRALPAVRERIETDLRTRGLGRDKVLAAVVQLLDDTLIRVGNDAYAETNESYGLTTLHQDHASVSGSTIELEFVAKHGREHEVELRDPRLARIVRQCQELPGEELFQYVEGDGVVDVTSTHVNDYVREATGGPFTAKDFRTWGGTVVATETLTALDPPADREDRDLDADVLAAVDAAADRLANTRAVCRSCYVHPRVEEAYRAGELHEAWRASRSGRWYSRGESALLKVLDDGDERTLGGD